MGLEPPTLAFDQVCKSFERRRVVDGLSLSLRPGELYALLGPNGAGKTTTLRMAAGLLAPDAGAIRIAGVDAAAQPLAARRLTAWVPDEPPLYDRLTGWEHLEFIAGLWELEPKAAQARAEGLLQTLGLWDHRAERCQGYSRGMKQKTALACALLHEPRLLLLDEPLTGLDAVAARQVKDLLQALVRQGVTVVLSTHILEIAERLADRIGILHGGRLRAEGDLAELRALVRGRQSLEDVFLDLTGEAGAPLA
jgi:ABC-2 type transport system ATP-binding protein